MTFTLPEVGQYGATTGIDDVCLASGAFMVVISFTSVGKQGGYGGGQGVSGFSAERFMASLVGYACHLRLLFTCSNHADMSPEPFLRVYIHGSGGSGDAGGVVGRCDFVGSICKHGS